MNPDEDICLCFHVSKRKIVNFCRRECPSVPSLVSQCLAAGTGCGWCVPFLKTLHKQVSEGARDPDLPLSPAEYAALRLEYHQTGIRRGIDDPDNQPDEQLE